MSDPITTTGALASAANKLKDMPLWLLTGAALCLTVFLAVPDLRLLVAPTTTIVIEFGAIAAWIFAACRSAGPMIGALQAYRTSAAAQVRFVVTPIEGQCFWATARQKEGPLLTQVSAHFLATNRTDERLYVMTARLLKPNIRGEVLPASVTTRAIDSGYHGSAHSSGHFIPPKMTLPVSLVILIHGAPNQKPGTMEASIEFGDADGHKARVSLKLKYIGAADGWA